MYRTKTEEKEEDRIAQEAIRSGANRSLSVLEKAFIQNGSGRYLVLRTTDPDSTIDIGARSLELGLPEER